MKFPNNYLRNVKPYNLASHKIWSVDPKERQQILKLDWNEATVPPSPLVLERVRTILDEPSFFNLYPSTFNDDLLTLLANYVGSPKENIQFFASSDVLHEYVCKAFISVGDKVMILAPSYDNFRLTCQASGADVHFSYYNEDFSFDPVHFEEDILAYEPAVVYICNPNNPTGNVHKLEYIDHLLHDFPDTLFLIDEAYYEFSGVTAKDLVLQYDNILISRTMSKAFALANFRLGYLIAGKDNVQFINKIRNPKNLSTIAQTAACAALADLQYMWNYVTEVHKGMAYFFDAMQQFSMQLIVYPSYGNFVLVQTASYENKMALIRYLAGNNIFVRDTTQTRSVRNCFRITIGTMDQMKKVINVIKHFYNN